MNESSYQEGAGKVNHHKPAVGAPEKSAGNIVPEKRANKGDCNPAEPVEGKTPTKRNPEEATANRTLSRGFASEGLDRVRQRAEEDRRCTFNNLFQFLKVDLLRWSFYQLKQSAAAGLDGIEWGYYKTGRSA